MALYSCNTDNIQYFYLTGEVAPGIHNPLHPCPVSGYTDHSATTFATLKTGNTYSGNVVTSNFYPEENVRIWIDYNQNGLFEASETIDTLQNLRNYSTGLFSFTVPTSTPAGTYKLRVRMAKSMNPLLIDPCDYITYGEALDFGINIIPGCVSPPIVNLGPDTALCVGQTLTLNAGLSNSSNTKLWSNNATSQSITISTPGIYSVTVSDGSCPRSDTIIISTKPTPVVDLGNNIGFCPGQSVVLNAGAANSSFSKLWNTNDTTQTLEVFIQGSYSVTVTNNASSCFSKDSIYVGYFGIPNVNLGNDTTICAGQSMTLNVGLMNNYFIKYWSTGASGQSAQSINITNAGVYSVLVSSPGNCSTSDTIIVSVDSLPLVSLGNDTAICVGETLILDVGSANSSNLKLWNNADTTQTIPVSTAGTYSVKVTNGFCSKSDTIVLSVNPLPVVNLGVDTAICAGQTLTLDVGSANSSYLKLWNTADTTQTIPISAAGTYSVKVTNGFCSKSDTMVLSVNPLPVVNLGVDTAICAGEILTLDAQNQGSTYQWSNSSTNQTINITTAGTYFVAVTKNGCSTSDTVAVGVLALASIDGILTTGSTPAFDFSPDNPANVTSYFWDFGDGATSNTAVSSHTYTQTGFDQTFLVSLIVANVCGEDTVSTSVVVKPSSIGRFKISSNSLKFFPNPTAETVTLENESSYKMTNVSIINILGQEVLNEKINNFSKHRMNVRNLNPGLYTVKIDFKEGTVTRKLEIIR